MNRRTNIINFTITMIATLATLFAVVYVCNSNYQQTMAQALVKIAVGAIIAGFIHTALHELGHVVAGKLNGFEFSSVTVWFFRWCRIGKKIKFSFVMMGEEAGYTEMIPKHPNDLPDRLKKISQGGYLASLILAFIGIPALFVAKLPVFIYCIWAMFLPTGAYIFFNSALPTTNYGTRNDGGVVYGISKNDDVSKVTINLLKIQANLYQGKTPSQIDEGLYFDLPQLPEDDVNFIMLLSARYLYYLDKEDYENAKKITDRLVGLIDDIPKAYRAPIMVDALYNACTFDFDENKADNITEDYEKFLNNVNTAAVVRAKLAYLLYVKGETELFDIFYKKGVKEAARCQIKGLGEFEKKLFDKMKADFNNKIN